MTFMQDLWIETLTKILLSADITVLSLEGFQDVCRKKWENLVGFGLFCFCLLRSYIKKTLWGICLAVLRNASHGREHVNYEETAAYFRRAHTVH